MSQRTEKEKEQIRKQLENLYDDKYAELLEVTFRDYEDEELDMAGTVTKILVDHHIRTLDLTDLSKKTRIHGVKKEDRNDSEWWIHISEEPFLEEV